MRDLRDAVRLIAVMAFRAHRRLALQCLAISAVNALAPIATGVVMRGLIDDVAAGADHYVPWSLALAATFSVVFASAIINGWTTSVVIEHCVHAWYRELIRINTSAEGISHYERPAFQDQLEVIRQQPGALGLAYPAIVSCSMAVTFAFVSLGLLVSVHAGMAALVVLAIPSVVTIARAEAHLRKAREATAEPRRLANRFLSIGTSHTAAAEIRVARLASEITLRHRRPLEQVDAAMSRVERRSELTALLGRLAFALGYIGAVVLAVEGGLNGDASVGDVVLTVYLAAAINNQVRAILINIRRSQAGLDAARRIGWLRDVEHESRSRGTLPPPEGLREGITLTDITFRYPSSATDALRAVNLALPAGRVVALVGENGAGKTTLVKLLTGMYQPTAGTVSIDDRRLDELDMSLWRGRASAAFQDFARFELVLRESVGVGDLSRIDDRAAIMAAVDRAGVEDLPDQLGGWDTELGTSFLGGRQLSGGQWQQVALGRTMMRDLPLLLVLDEPAASLDPDAEQRLFERYAQQARRTASEVGTITLLVTHRLSTVRMADLIVVLEAGQVTETGTHDELMARGGTYAELYALQASGYGS